MSMLQRHIYLIGMPGCGKSSLGKRVASRLQLPYVDTDVVLTELMKMDTRQILENYGEEAFRNTETNMLISLIDMQPCIISTGGGVSLKALNRKIMHDNGLVVLIDRTLEDIMGNFRIEKRPLLAKKDIDEVKKIYDDRMPIYKSIADVVFTNSEGFDAGIAGLENICNNEM